MTSDARVRQELLQEAWAALGGPASVLDLLAVTGERPDLLPSRLPAAPAMIAATGASTLAAAVLDAARRGAPAAPVHLDAEHVALAARSERHARMDGVAGAGMFAPLSRFWRTSDGWLRLHANYPWHRDRALRVLDCADHPESVADAVATWRGEDLEDALAAAGAIGYAVRTPRQWQGHPQARALASAPLVERAGGGGPARRLGPGRGLHGARVLDLTRVIAGPVATRTLAAWGADVLRLDHPGLAEIPAQALDTLPGKRSGQLDLSGAVGRARLEELLDAAHVVVQGYRPGALARYGLAPDDLAVRHPHLSVVSLSAWGRGGPWAARRGFDSVVQCPTGIAAIEGDDDQPGALPAQVLDHATGYLAAAAALLAVAEVERGGPPQAVSLSLQRTAQWLAAAPVASRAPAERTPDPEPYLTTLPGAAAPVHVLRSPGRAGDLEPRWEATTDLYRDGPSFATGGG